MPCCVYILASKRNGALYIGVTSNLKLRIQQHKTNATPGFTSKYGVKTLVYFECTDDMQAAIAREKAMKKWNRKWKVDLIETDNPKWRDLYYEL